VKKTNTLTNCYNLISDTLLNAPVNNYGSRDRERSPALVVQNCIGFAAG